MEIHPIVVEIYHEKNKNVLVMVVLEEKSVGSVLWGPWMSTKKEIFPANNPCKLAPHQFILPYSIFTSAPTKFEFPKLWTRRFSRLRHVFLHPPDNLTRFLTHWCKFLAAAQPKSAVTQITSVVFILILGCSELKLKCHYATYRVPAQTAEWHRIQWVLLSKVLICYFN